jgi:hypothetical protein
MPSLQNILCTYIHKLRHEHSPILSLIFVTGYTDALEGSPMNDDEKEKGKAIPITGR